MWCKCNIYYYLSFCMQVIFNFQEKIFPYIFDNYFSYFSFHFLKLYFNLTIHNIIKMIVLVPKNNDFTNFHNYYFVLHWPPNLNKKRYYLILYSFFIFMSSLWITLISILIYKFEEPSFLQIMICIDHIN